MCPSAWWTSGIHNGRVCGSPQQLLETEKYKVETITGTIIPEDWNTKCDKSWFINDKLAEDYGYTHLIATSKRTFEFEERVACRLYNECFDKTIYLNGYYIVDAIGAINLWIFFINLCVIQQRLIYFKRD